MVEKSCSRSQGQPASGSRRHAITQSSRSIGDRSFGITAGVSARRAGAPRTATASTPRARPGSKPARRGTGSRARSRPGRAPPTVSGGRPRPGRGRSPARARPRSSGWRAGRMRPRAAALPPVACARLRHSGGRQDRQGYARAGAARPQLVHGQSASEALELTRVVAQEAAKLVGEPVELAREAERAFLQQLGRRTQTGRKPPHVIHAALDPTAYGVR